MISPTMRPRPTDLATTRKTESGQRPAIGAVELSGPTLANQPAKVDFSDVLSEAVDGVRTAFKESGDATSDALLGRGSPHTAMIAMSKAGITFRFVTQTRNKLVEAYREIMNLQV